MKKIILPILILLIISTSSCQINPASGEKEFSLINTKEEDDIGKSEHIKIIKQFGIYKNKNLQNYINSLGNFLVSTSELSNKKFTFTILNTPIVNAFALPGGFIYLTRGLLALCNNEAQLAGVISHEIGHITARHTARRYTKSVGTNLILNILNTLAKNQVAQNLLGQSAGLFLLSYSRSQEYEADKLALRYMNRAGFEPIQMANFLQSMENYSKIKSDLLNLKNKGSELLRTHPNSSKRVNKVISEAKDSAQLSPIVGREIFLRKIDGLLFGYNQDEGFFLKDRFVHPELNITFPLISDFYFINTPKRVIGLNDNKSQIIYDIDNSETNKLSQYLVSWAGKFNTKLKKIKSFETDDMQFEIGEGKIKNDKILLGVISSNQDEFIHRFALISKKKDYPKTREQFIDLIENFRKIGVNEFLPPKIKIITVSPEENFLERTINSMNLQEKEARKIFNVLNNVQDINKMIGQKIKIIY